MKTKLFCLLSFLLLSLGIKAQTISIPDAYFKAKLLSSSPANTVAKDLSGNYFSIDANGNGQIEQSEASQVSALEIIYPESNLNNTDPIQNYQGILSFVNAKSIKIDYWNTPASGLGISNLNVLENLDISFNNSDPGNASVSNCSNLKNFKIRGIPIQVFSGVPSLKNVDIMLSYGTPVQDILTTIASSGYLEKLRLSGDFLFNNSSNPVLNLSHHQSLKEVNITDVSLAELNLSHCNFLDTLHLVNNGSSTANPPSLGLLDISSCPLFINLNFNGNIKISSLSANNCPNLQTIECSSDLGALSVNNCPVLNQIKLNNLTGSTLTAPFQTANCPALKNINILGYGYSSFDATDAVNLEHLYLGSPGYYPAYYTNFFGPLESLNISGNSQLKTLGLGNHIMTQLSINGLPKLESVSASLQYQDFQNYSPLPDFTTQFLQSVNIQNCPLLTGVSFEGQKGLKNVTIKNCPSLQQFQHGPFVASSVPVNWNLANLNIEDCNALQSVDVSYNKLTELKIKNASNLETVKAVRNDLTSFDFTNTVNLKTLKITGNQFTSLNTASIPSVISLDAAYNKLNSITGTSSNLKNLSVLSNNLTDLNIHNFPNLDSLIMGRNKITDVDFSGHLKIRNISEVYADMAYFDIGLPFANDGTFTKTFNVNNCTNLEMVLLESQSIEKIFAKNGKNEYFSFPYNSALQYICCDASQITAIEDSLAMEGIVCNVNDYCNFVPGGSYNTITGTVKFDDNNNGCDAGDAAFEHMKIKVSNGTTTEETFVKTDGSYNLYTQTGNITVTAEPENPALYTVTPSAFNVNFVNNNTVSTQDICVTRNGNIKDLEVVFAPVTDARPGFDAVYKVIWRNKGNTSLSGSTTVTFNNSKMNFMSSSLPSSVSGNQVTFNFTSLKPYSNTASEITFNINPPTHATNPVNIGDQLNFAASVTPVSGDANPADNSFNYNQTVTGSFDPNDITCMEGSQIPVSMTGKDLHYIINFENTGNAPATHIVVEMDIDPNDFNVPSLQLQHTSHGTYTKTTGNKAEFMMKNINLAASAHGNIILKIKTKNSLASGDSVSGKANIYFDYNFPVATNEAVTVIGGTVLQTLESAGKSGVHVYPNPTKGEVNIESDSKINSVEIYDIQGRIIQKQIGINTEKTKISLHTAASGVYYFKVFTEKASFMKKVIKN